MWYIHTVVSTQLQLARNPVLFHRIVWTPTHGHAIVGRPARAYLHQFCTDTGCSFEDPLGAMDDRDSWRET